MRFFYVLFLGLGVCFMVACGGSSTTSATTSSNETSENSTTDEKEETVDNYNINSPAPATHNCTITNEILEDNQIWLREDQRLVCITADSSTYDESYGPGHRILEVYNTENCEQIMRQLLPTGVSPDFPYYLAKISYTNATGIVAITNFDGIFLYNVKNNSLVQKTPIKPEFRYPRDAEDAQTGMIQRLEVWENYLIGYAQDQGCFAFDISNQSSPKAVLATAEYKTPQDGFASLFMLPTGDDKVQVLIPSYDYDKDEFSINPMLNAAKAISDKITDSARNNRYLVLREKNSDQTPHAFDLQAHSQVELPADVTKKGTQAILDYIKKQ